MACGQLRAHVRLGIPACSDLDGLVRTVGTDGAGDERFAARHLAARRALAAHRDSLLDLAPAPWPAGHGGVCSDFVPVSLRTRCRFLLVAPLYADGAGDFPCAVGGCALVMGAGCAGVLAAAGGRPDPGVAGADGT